MKPLYFLRRVSTPLTIFFMEQDHNRLCEMDDSAKCGINLNKARARRRIFVPIRTHSLNKSGNTCNMAENAAKPPFGKSG
jgi:hypothetical protein